MCVRRLSLSRSLALDMTVMNQNVPFHLFFAVLSCLHSRELSIRERCASMSESSCEHSRREIAIDRQDADSERILSFRLLSESLHPAVSSRNPSRDKRESRKMNCDQSKKAGETRVRFLRHDTKSISQNKLYVSLPTPPHPTPLVPRNPKLLLLNLLIRTVPLRINLNLPISRNDNLTSRHPTHPIQFHSSSVQRQDSPRRLAGKIDIGRRDFRVGCGGCREGVRAVELDRTGEDGDVCYSAADGEDPAFVEIQRRFERKEESTYNAPRDTPSINALDPDISPVFVARTAEKWMFSDRTGKRRNSIQARTR